MLMMLALTAAADVHDACADRGLEQGLGLLMLMILVLPAAWKKGRGCLCS